MAGQRRIAITCGDPSGVGPELIRSVLASQRFEGASFRVYGAAPWLESLQATALNDLELIPLSEVRFEAGRPEEAGARLAVEALEAAAQACRDGQCSAVVTGPIAKARCAQVGFAFPGQTEFFGARWGGDPSMAFVGARLKLCLATWHIPLAAVSAALTESVFKRAVRRAVELGRRCGLAAPRLAICGLNPHAGEGGLLGSEEVERLNPWIEELASELGPLSPCVPGDTAFMLAMKGEVDVVVALYHDQGLAPFKAIDFDSGVNVSLGLPHLRVSPDHGTGFEIAGKGLASDGSMGQAIRLAVEMR